MSIAKHVVLAGDIGGTKSLLGLFDPVPARPRPLTVREYATADFDSMEAMVNAFLRDARPDDTDVRAACLGVAGPVVGARAQLTNVPWLVDAREVGDRCGVGHVLLLNDLEAMAHAIRVLRESELRVLQEGEALRDGHQALIAAGTGLGEALLHGVDGRLVPMATEAGHADWAPRTEREVVVWRDLTARFGRVEVEQVVSGPGLVNLHRVTHTGACRVVPDPHASDAPAAISSAAMAGRCDACVEAFAIFVEAYGAEAGNLALRASATGGLFVGGGIAPRILPALSDGRFIDAFIRKAPFEAVMRRTPVKVILNAEAGLLGAAVRASAG
jgi:glucokinase